ncbi:hypothetical protein [Microbacterium hominis]|uniref:Uncharacterized protein n=1 Tax=Microbacterium hominis TaxID=162426 RepID=A0A7D4TPJ1_9MICO|nr:hypothetical protein [Microbacterium hominis]QKJ18264.1 hypothetical protein HQM25_01845 [Microbacterium hominis]
MPVVTVTAAPHPGVDRLVLSVAEAVAEALSLGTGDVIATFVPSGASAVSGADAAASVSFWPIVSIHGSNRGREKMDAARTAAESAVRAWTDENRIDCEGVWTQWLTPLPE